MRENPEDFLLFLKNQQEKGKNLELLVNKAVNQSSETPYQVCKRWNTNMNLSSMVQLTI